MKVAILLVVMLVMSLAVSVYVYAEQDSLMKSLRDEPNFYPKITKEEINGKIVEIIEFRDKLAK